jgi:succinoglycan biosynthesis transport protein ExoP
MAPLTTTLKDRMDIVHLFGVLRRRMALVVMTMAVATGLGVALTFSMTPKYTASSDVLLDVRKTTVIDMQAVVGGLQNGDVAAIRSEVDVIASPALLERVITDLGLLSNPDFNPALDTRKHLKDYIAQVLVLPPTVANLLFPAEDLTALTPDERERRTMAEAVRRLQANLGVYNDQGRSYTIRISYTATDPKLAARIVNAVAQQYLTSQLEAKYQKTQEVNRWLQDKLADLKQRVESADDAVQAYRRANNLLSTPAGGTVASQQLNDLNTQLALAQADAAQKHGALRQFQSTVKEGIARAERLAEVLASPTISALKVQEADANRRLADLETRFGEKYPTVISAKQERAAIQARIAAEIQKIVGTMANEAQAADYRVEQLRSDLAKLSLNVQQNNQAEVKLQELQREAQANRMLYENMLNRFKETSESQDIQQPDATIIAKADIPVLPSFPNKPLFSFMAALAAACLGLAFALLAERLDNCFRSGAEVEEYTGVRGIGLVPSVADDVRDELIRRPASPFSEAMRTIRSQLALSSTGTPPRIILVTSAAPGEGKSTTAFSLARASAQAGVSTLLVDCDWRRPSLHKMIGMRNDVSLLDVFRGEANPEELIQTDGATGLSFVAGRHRVHNPNDLLAGPHMKNFLIGALDRYELIVLDSPPVMAASDAMILSRLVDATLFVVRWGATPRQVVVNAIKMLQNAEAKLAGAVINQVDVRKHRRYGFGDQTHYYGYHRGAGGEARMQRQPGAAFAGDPLLALSDKQAAVDGPRR